MAYKKNSKKNEESLLVLFITLIVSLMGIIILAISSIIKLIKKIIIKIKNKKRKNEIVNKSNFNTSDTFTIHNNIENDKPYESLMTICDSMYEIIEEANEFYYNIEDSQGDVDIEIDALYSEIEDYELIADNYKNMNIGDISIDIINKAKEDLKNLEELCDEMINEYKIHIDKIDESYNIKDENNSILNDKIDTNNEENKKIERLKNKWGLSDNEVEEVLNDHYDPWNFEEEDLDEEDYYYEDEEE